MDESPNSPAIAALQTAPVIPEVETGLRQRRRARTRRDRIAALGYPIGMMAALILLWEVAARLLSIPPFLLPAPSAILQSMNVNASVLIHDSVGTTIEIVLGFALSVAVGVPLALAIGGPVVTHLLALFGWRWAFGVLFIASLVWLPVWLIFFRNDPAQSRHVNAAERALIQDGRNGPPPAHGRLSWGDARALLTNRTLVVNYWAFFVFGYYLFFFMGWLPTYLYEVYHLNLHAVGAFTVLPWLAAAAALWAISHWSDHLLRKTGRLRYARSYLIAGTQFVAALAVIPVAFGISLNVAIICITVAVAASMGANAAYFAVNADVMPKRAATGAGITDFTFALSGFFAPVLTGWVLNLRGNFTDAFLLMAALAASSVVLVLAFHNPDRDRLRD